MKPLLKTLPSALVILLFVYAAGSKLANLDLFRVQLHRQTFPHAWASVLLYAIPAAELVTVALLLFNRTALQGLLSSLALLIVFTVYICLVLSHWWDRVPCPCGSILNHLSWNAHLWFNLAFIAANLVAINIHLVERRLTATT